MKKKDTIIIIGIIFTLILAELFLFYRLYNQHFEIQANERQNPYILLKNGKYFEMECENDVIDNKVDFSFKPFEQILKKDLAISLIEHNQMCSDGEKNNRNTHIEKRRDTVKITHEVKMDVENVKEDSYYYTQLDYPVTPVMEDHNDYIEIYDSLCTITIPKRIGYEYRILGQSLRIGKKYEDNMTIEIDLNIKCL